MKKNSSNTIFLAAGGTGGHIFPAISLAEEVGKRGYKVILVTDKRTEKYLSKSQSFSLEFIPVKYPYGNLLKKFVGGISLIHSYFSARKLIKKHQPICVIGFGGYPSFPTLYAATGKKVRTIIHEQNSVLGKANQMLSSKVSVIATSFPEVSGIDVENLKKVEYTGNPVRPTVQAIRALPYPDFGDNSTLHILVTGGSQGATVFSNIVPEAIKLLSPEYRSRIRIEQQCRKEDLEDVKNKYKEMAVSAEVSSFFNDLPNRMASAHLLICRSGASSLAEASIAGRPIIMVPLKTSKDNHQMINANSYEDLGAGWVMPEEAFTPEELAFKIENFFKLPSLLSDVAKKSREAGSENADKKLADIVERLAKN